MYVCNEPDYFVRDFETTFQRFHREKDLSYQLSAGSCNLNYVHGDRKRRISGNCKGPPSVGFL
jgi:hypothetical protein